VLLPSWVYSWLGGDERGLLGLAFHPQYASNGKVYVYHSSGFGTSQIRTRVSRFLRHATKVCPYPSLSAGLQSAFALHFAFCKPDSSLTLRPFPFVSRIVSIQQLR